jgi:DNA replication ATP-dependent helicase Dna2
MIVDNIIIYDVTPSFFWRIDKDEISSGIAVVKENLIKLFTVNGDEKRRRLIVDLDTPQWKPESEIDYSTK